jgi:hypothetical protein
MFVFVRRFRQNHVLEFVKTQERLLKKLEEKLKILDETPAL